ncbi:MAG TPA: GNAT family N-acetyltransferase [Anaerolineales bacterium]|nr:GNAT family N-acetyltransferase [Anaerolineales bacterium]
MTEIILSNAPAIPGLIFRHFRGEADYPGMVAAILASSDADGTEMTVSVEEMARAFQHLTNCDPFQDILLTEVDGEIVGYSRGWWVDDLDGTRLYRFSGFLAPAWRRKGIGSTMLEWMENHLRELAATHSTVIAKFFRPSGIDYRETGAIALLERAGYQPIRYFHNMVRPTLEDIQDFPLPEGLEVRPALPEHYHAIWINVEETSEDEWGNSKPTEEKYQRWLADPHFQPELWQIAWDVATDKPVGHVLTFIDHPENEKYNRKRGYTEGIGVDRTWRRQGVARALISLSLKAQKAAGMTESALVADSDSVSNVTRLYESCGFQTVYTDTVYQKAF